MNNKEHSNATDPELEAFRRIEKWNEIKKEYDQADLGGAALIDGHHVFLKIIEEIADFRGNSERWIGKQKIRSLNQKAEDYLARLRKTETFSFDPLAVAQFYSHLVLRLSAFAHKKVYEKMFNDGRKIIFDEHRFNPKLATFLEDHPPQDFVLINAQSSTYVFDAVLPDRKALITRFKQNLKYWSNKKNWKQPRHRYSPQNIQGYIDELEAGLWSFYAGDEKGDITVPYNLKNETLAMFQADVFKGKWKLTALDREIHAQGGKRESREKGVDTSLVIKGCELAYDKDCDWVCLVTNDTDHAPLASFLRANGKEVYLNGITERKRVGKKLIDSLESKENYLSLEEASGFISGEPNKNVQFNTNDAIQQWLLTQALLELDHQDRGWEPPSHYLRMAAWEYLNSHI